MEFLLSIIEGNETVNYSVVLICFVVYVLFLWVSISVWVARDAARRYNTSYAGALWFILVFLLNFPALMFYFVVRPDDFRHSHMHHGGVNVPLVNFVGKDAEVLFGLELKINPNELTENVRDMRLSIDWDSNDQKKEVTTESLVIEAEVSQKRLDKIIDHLKKNVRANKLKDLSRQISENFTRRSQANSTNLVKHEQQDFAASQQQTKPVDLSESPPELPLEAPLRPVQTEQTETKKNGNIPVEEFKELAELVGDLIAATESGHSSDKDKNNDTNFGKEI